MTILNFTKTRVVYWTGTENQIVAPTDYNSLPTGVTKTFGDGNFNYNVYSIAGTSHNWHNVPMNYYGLYCTPQEMLMMYQNNSEIKPLNMKCTIGHSIPLNTTTSGNITNLSFNNTIYSLIHDLPPNDWVTMQPWGLNVSVNQQQVFFETYDGGRRDDKNQLLLPQCNIWFKVPYVEPSNVPMTIYSTGTDQTITAAEQARLTAPFTTELQGNNTIYLTQNNLVNMYLPEVLICNGNTKALYPGENQDFMEINIKDNGYATINTSQIRVNEYFSNKDDRNWGMNSNMPLPSLTNLNVVPLIQGTQKPNITISNTNVYDVNTPWTESDINPVSTTDVQSFQTRFMRETIRNRHNCTESDMYSSLLPNKLIKCLPIVDNTEANITHSVCATITWEITLDVKEEIMHISNPYVTNIAFKDRVLGIRSSAIDTFQRTCHEWYTNRWPYKPMSHDIQKVRNRNYYHDRTVDSADERSTRIPTQLTTTTFQLPNSEMISDGAFLHGVLINQPTNTFVGVNTFSRRPVTRSMTKAHSVSSLINDAMES